MFECRYTDGTEIRMGPVNDLICPRTKGTWDGRCYDPSLSMFREAVKYAYEMGLTPDFIPELRSENGVLHAFKENGEKIRLEHGPDWAYKTGFAKLVEERTEQMRKCIR